jgi:8-oxo-dGTP pyrophosphatase MutT (NUDIX family)
VADRLRRLAELLPSYALIAWSGLVTPRARSRAPLRVVQAVILEAERVLLTVRIDLRGWELPGGGVHPGESDEAATRREILEETGLDVEVERRVGDYVRSGFLPHTARVFLCRPVGGTLRASSETPRVRWFDVSELPGTLFPWYRVPLEDALHGGPEPVHRHEHLGVAAVWAGLRIDLRMRLSGDRAG